LVTYLGMIFAGLGFAFGIFTVMRVLAGGASLQGWPSLVTIVVCLSGLQLLMLGIISEYLWRSFDEARRRPPYVVRQRVGFDRGNSDKP
jgi:dolichol-phosphate mannosyltransferase